MGGCQILGRVRRVEGLGGAGPFGPNDLVLLHVLIAKDLAGPSSSAALFRWSAATMLGRGEARL
jgi:hypothetical protein